MPEEFRISVPTGKPPPCLRELLTFLADTREKIKTSYLAGRLIGEAMSEPNRAQKFPFSFNKFTYDLADSGGYAITVNFDSQKLKDEFGAWSKPAGQAIWCCKVLRIQVERTLEAHKIDLTQGSDDWTELRNFLFAKRRALQLKNGDFVQPAINDFKRVFGIDLGSGKKSR
ncbi:MAG: hypothetical protein WCF18_13275 [Chthoniobacteraceae bacterium]